MTDAHLKRCFISAPGRFASKLAGELSAMTIVCADFGVFAVTIAGAAEVAELIFIAEGQGAFTIFELVCFIPTILPATTRATSWRGDAGVIEAPLP